MRRRFAGAVRVRTLTLALIAATVAGAALAAQAPAPSKGVAFARISETEMREWLTTLSSDAMQGRRAFTEGYGLAASYVADQLKRFGVKPLGDAGTYFQTVRRLGYRATRNSTITVRANGQERTFKHGDHVTFAANGGGPQTLRFDRVDFVGYGLIAERAGERYSDFDGRDVKGRLVVWLPGTPASIGPAGGTGRDALITAGNRSSFVINNLQAAGVLTFQARRCVPGRGRAVARAGRRAGGGRGRS